MSDQPSFDINAALRDCECSDCGSVFKTSLPDWGSDFCDDCSLKMKNDTSDQSSEVLGVQPVDTSAQMNNPSAPTDSDPEMADQASLILEQPSNSSLETGKDSALEPVDDLAAKPAINQSYGSVTDSPSDSPPNSSIDLTTEPSLDSPNTSAMTTLNNPTPVCLCCCGCRGNVDGSHHWCSVTNKRVFAWCYSEGVVNGFGSRHPCKGCVKTDELADEESPRDSAINLEPSAAHFSTLDESPLIEESAILDYDTKLIESLKQDINMFTTNNQNFKNVVFRGFTDTSKYLETIVEYNITTNELGNAIVTNEKGVIIVNDEGAVAGETDKRKIYVGEDVIIIGEDNIDREWVNKTSNM